MDKIKQQLEDLEERAEELDKQRTKGLTAIRYTLYQTTLIERSHITKFRIYQFWSLVISSPFDIVIIHNSFTIIYFSYINERNRQNNLIRAEEALKVSGCHGNLLLY